MCRGKGKQCREGRRGSGAPPPVSLVISDWDHIPGATRQPKQRTAFQSNVKRSFGSILSICSSKMLRDGQVLGKTMDNFCQSEWMRLSLLDQCSDSLAITYVMGTYSEAFWYPNLPFLVLSLHAPINYGSLQFTCTGLWISLFEASTYKRQFRDFFSRYIKEPLPTGRNCHSVFIPCATKSSLWHFYYYDSLHNDAVGSHSRYKQIGKIHTSIYELGIWTLE